MVVEFTTTYAISAYHRCCEFESRSRLGVQHYMEKFVSDLRQVGGFSPGPPVSSTNKTDRHDITELLLKVALNTTKQTNKHQEELLAHSHVSHVGVLLYLYMQFVIGNEHNFLSSAGPIYLCVYRHLSFQKGKIPSKHFYMFAPQDAH